MNRTRRLASSLFLLVLATSCGIGAPPVAPEGGPGPVIAFAGVNVIPMDSDRVLQDQTVLVVDGRILSIADAADGEIPAGAQLIDASAKYLIPALSDMHIHLEGEAWNQMFPPEKQFPPEALDFEKLLYPYVANGVATVQVMSALPEHIELRERIARGEILGPRLVLSRMVDGPGRAWPPPISTWVSSPEEARQAVVDIHRDGYDSIKVYSFLDRASYEAILTTADEVGIGVGGHIPYEMSLEGVLDAGQTLIAHSEEMIKFARSPYTQEEIESCARTIAGSGAWITPTLTTSRHILAVFEDFEGELARPEARYLHPMDLGIWSFIHTNLYQPIPQDQRTMIRDGYEQFQRPLTRALNAAGARLMTGTDALIPSNVPGFSVHDELAELVDVGLSPYEALRSSTTEPHAFLGEIDEAGTISVGKRADLVLLESNPLADIAATRDISGVMIRGQWIGRDEIQRGLEELAVAYQAESNSARTKP
jgi:cytosine/adenosine deaminase-related metal-dependent hydrolase